MNTENTCIIIDFDGTITEQKVNGEVVPSIISILRSENHMSQDYTDKAYLLAGKYMPIEKDPLISFAEKYKAMNEWWILHLELLLESGLRFDHIKSAVKSPKLVLRKGFREVVDFADLNNLPIIIFSASGIGYEPIDLFLDRENISKKNITIVSNQFVWDKNGNAVGRSGQLVHSLSKTGEVLKQSKAWDKIETKTNAIVIGDHLHDVSMSTGIDFSKVATFGVVNEIKTENVELYKKTFNNVILDGESLEKVLEVF